MAATAPPLGVTKESHPSRSRADRLTTWLNPLRNASHAAAKTMLFAEPNARCLTQKEKKNENPFQE